MPLDLNAETISGGLFIAAATWLSGKGLEAFLRGRKAYRDELIEDRNALLTEKHHQEERMATGQDLLIEELRTQVKNILAEMRIMQGDMKALQTDHVQCVQAQAELKGQNAVLTKQIENQDKEIESLRDWRHNLADIAHKEHLDKALARELLDPAKAALLAAVTAAPAGEARTQ